MFFKEYCWYRQVSIVTFGNTSGLALKTIYNHEDGENNILPIFVNGVLMVNPQFNNDFALEFTEGQKLIGTALRVSLTGKVSHEAKSVLHSIFPDTVTDTEIDAAPHTAAFIKVVKDVYSSWMINN